MKTIHYYSAVLLLVGLVAFSSGCSQGASGSSSASGDFAPGAFPPTLSREDYHSNAWNTDKDKCLTCHETGVNDAPKVRHTSLTDEAKQAKCRSCHLDRGEK